MVEQWAWTVDENLRTRSKEKVEEKTMDLRLQGMGAEGFAIAGARVSIRVATCDGGGWGCRLGL